MLPIYKLLSEKHNYQFKKNDLYHKTGKLKTMQVFSVVYLKFSFLWDMMPCHGITGSNFSTTHHHIPKEQSSQIKTESETVRS
jgi:hypothetical protein